jgi:folate-binding protein YgfZ
MPAPLPERLGAKAQRGEYCGAETALSFGDARAEFEALRRGCGVYDLSRLAPFRIAGQDRVRWMNGMVSNNIRALPQGRGHYNFLLNAQGQIQGDLYVYNRGDDFLGITERAQFGNLLALLRKYIIMDKVELIDLSSEMAAVGLQGPQARALMERAGVTGIAFPPPDDEPRLKLEEAAWEERKLTVIQHPQTLAPASLFPAFSAILPDKFEFWLNPAAVSSFWGALLAAGAVPAGAQALEMWRVAAGIPRYGVDIGDRDLPQETGQHRALSYTKGCYLGQEIVERTHSRGSVHRILKGLLVDGLLPAAGAKLRRDGQDIGIVTSAQVVPTGEGDRVLALGYVRREAAEPGAQVALGNGKAVIYDLPS